VSDDRPANPDTLDRGIAEHSDAHFGGVAPVPLPDAFVVVGSDSKADVETLDQVVRAKTRGRTGVLRASSLGAIIAGMAAPLEPVRKPVDDLKQLRDAARRLTPAAARPAGRTKMSSSRANEIRRRRRVTQKQSRRRNRR
jgi:hypothetical protein